MNEIVYPSAENPSAETLRDRLRNDTRDEHRSLEAALDLMRPDLSRTDYRALLARFHAFNLAFDDWIAERAMHGWPAAVFYGNGRGKSERLARDLAALGTTPGPIDSRIRADLPAWLPSPAHAWGAVYVVEGSTLGGMLLSKHFGDLFGIDRDSGLDYFSGYGKDTARHWSDTLQQLQRHEEGHADDIVEGARRTFGFLRRHLAAAA